MRQMESAMDIYSTISLMLLLCLLNLFSVAIIRSEEILITRQTFESLCEFDTALLANTRGYLDSTPPADWYMSGAINSLTPEIGPIAGIAVTAKMDSSTPGGKPDMENYFDQVDRMRKMDLPLIWVVETVGSRPEHECVLGDGMAKMLHAAGCLGAVCESYCRDISGCKAVPFAVYGLGTIAHHEVMRFPEVDVPVAVGGITINPGDIIHADSEGVIRISEEIAEPLIDKAPDMRGFEQAVHAIFRRTDVDSTRCREELAKVLERYGFTTP
jgi:4-hydroxy-4-methyl-2-oxoglutarate aldolase